LADIECKLIDEDDLWRKSRGKDDQPITADTVTIENIMEMIVTTNGRWVFFKEEVTNL
jgi:hypothetical protein